MQAFKSYFFFAVLSLGFIALLQGCQRKESDLLIYENKCQDSLSSIDELLKQLKKEAENIQPDFDSNSERVEFKLRVVNSILIQINNALNDSKLKSLLYTDASENEGLMKAAALSCKNLIVQRQQSLFSDSKIYSQISQLDLSESPVTTQHFYNKLLSLFRGYGANRSSEDKAKILTYQHTIAESKNKLSNCSYDNSMTSCLAHAENMRNEKIKLAKILGYPNLSMMMLEQSMAIDKAVVLSFIEAVENKMNVSLGNYTNRDVSSKTDSGALNHSGKARLIYPDFRQGVFEAVTTLFKVEFFPSKKELNQQVSFTAEYYDVLKDGKKIGLLGINIVDGSLVDTNNDFHPIKSGIKVNEFSSEIALGMNIDEQLPEASIVLLVENKNEFSEKQLIPAKAAEDLILMMGQYMSHLSANEQIWQLNSGMAVERDFDRVSGYVLQAWFSRPKLLRKILFGASKKYLNDYKKISSQLSFYDIQKELIIVRLRMVFLELPTNMSSSKKLEVLNGSLKNFLEVYSLNTTPEENNEIVHRMLECHSYCYEALWSRMIAADLMTVINQWDELDEVMVKRFMSKIVLPGASSTAEDAVNDFLNRPYNSDAFFDYMSQKVL